MALLEIISLPFYSEAVLETNKYRLCLIGFKAEIIENALL